MNKCKVKRYVLAKSKKLNKKECFWVTDFYVARVERFAARSRRSWVKDDAEVLLQTVEGIVKGLKSVNYCTRLSPEHWDFIWEKYSEHARNFVSCLYIFFVAVSTKGRQCWVLLLADLDKKPLLITEPILLPMNRPSPNWAEVVITVL